MMYNDPKPADEQNSDYQDAKRAADSAKAAEQTQVWKPKPPKGG